MDDLCRPFGVHIRPVKLTHCRKRLIELEMASSCQPVAAFKVFRFAEKVRKSNAEIPEKIISHDR